MDKTIELLLIQARELKRYADILLEIRFHLSRHKELLNDSWIADEMEEINALIDRLGRKINWMIDEMYGIGYDMIKAYDEYFQEE